VTYNGILVEAGLRFNFPGGVLTTDAKALMLASLNHRHRQVLTKCPKLRDTTFPLTTVKGQQQYSLPPFIEKVKGIYDPKTSMRMLTNATRSAVRQYGPQAETTGFGPAAEWVDLGVVCYQNKMVAQPSTANTGNTLWASSTTNDTSVVTIEYLRKGGYASSATVTLTGTTAVQVGAHADIVELTKYFLSAAPNGYVSLNMANSTGTVISTLQPGATFARFKAILLFPTPNSSNTVLLMDVTRTIPEALATTTNLNDEPLLTLDAQWVLVEGIMMDYCAKISDGRYAQAKAEYEQGIKDLQGEVLNTDDLIIVQGGHQQMSNPFPWLITGTPYSG
jgi:hypothetical protein